MSPVARPRSIRAVQCLLVGIAVAGGLNMVAAPLVLIPQGGSWDMLGTAELLLSTIGATILAAMCLVTGVVLVRPIGRGAPWSRVVGWVAAGVITFGDLLEVAVDPVGYPLWYQPIYLTREVGGLLAVLAVAWLLHGVSADHFFDVSAPSSPADEARIWDISQVRGKTGGR